MFVVVVFVLACWLSFKILDQFPLEMTVSSLLHSGANLCRKWPLSLSESRGRYCFSIFHEAAASRWFVRAPS